MHNFYYKKFIYNIRVRIRLKFIYDRKLISSHTKARCFSLYDASKNLHVCGKRDDAIRLFPYKISKGTNTCNTIPIHAKSRDILLWPKARFTVNFSGWGTLTVMSNHLTNVRFRKQAFLNDLTFDSYGYLNLQEHTTWLKNTESHCSNKEVRLHNLQGDQIKNFEMDWEYSKYGIT